ncbi:thr operon leader peptide [Erwinia sp. CGal63]
MTTIIITTITITTGNGAG